VRILLATFLDAARADHVAAKWDGDRFIAFERGEELHIIWMSAWDDENAAREFFFRESEPSSESSPHPVRRAKAIASSPKAATPIDSSGGRTRSC